jgi:aldehyde dehydrogenase
LVQEDIYDAFIERVIDRVNKIKVGNPLDKTVMMGAQASQIQKDKILSYINLGKEEGAEVLTGGNVNNVGEGLEDGFYISQHYSENNKMRIFQEEIFGPVLAVTAFKDEEEAIEIANDTIYGLGAGVWTRDAHQLYRIPSY